ncbi:hypothetical protein [Hugenholtzia roseola]|uniref:hypothetical protein n=1 Tax=Hugenholtzia roseola TaxID=1002 RepID=UPI000686E7F6|nr:hypothetical protein [Hugenholtzia roseola]
MENLSLEESRKWIFKLNIHNATGKTLEVDDPRLQWGFWYLNNVDNRAPINVPSGKTIEVLGIRAADGTWTGYECFCRWKSDIGSIELKVDVPFSGSNKSHLKSFGFLRVEGWEDLPPKGHEFTRTITIMALSDSEQEQAINFDNEYAEYLSLMNHESEMVQNWEMFREEIKATHQFNPYDKIPSTYQYPPKKIYVGRSEVIEIDKREWDGIGDAKYQTLYEKEYFVKRYFAVAGYAINTNPRETQSIPAGVSVYTERTVDVQSSIKETLESFWSLKVSLEAESNNKVLGKKLAAKLEGTFSQKSVLEKSSSTFERNTQKVTVDKSAHDRLFVPWVFSQSILIYREKKDGTFGLVAVSEWADLIVDKVYSDKG